MLKPEQDEYSTVINSPETYKVIAESLRGGLGGLGNGSPVIFAWTDQEGSQLDILMAYGGQTTQWGGLQGGMKASTDLFVGVSRCGFFGFELNGSWKSPSYIGEKLGLGIGENATSLALSDLINGVCRELEK